jgi:hypothetical protein
LPERARAEGLEERRKAAMKTFEMTMGLILLVLAAAQLCIGSYIVNMETLPITHDWWLNIKDVHLQGTGIIITGFIALFVGHYLLLSADQ